MGLDSKRKIFISLSILVLLFVFWGIYFQNSIVQPNDQHTNSIHPTSESTINLKQKESSTNSVDYFEGYWDEWKEVIDKNTGKIRIFLFICWPYLMPFANPEAGTVEILPIPLSECPIDCEYILTKDNDTDAVMFAPDNFGDLVAQEKGLFESSEIYKILYDQESNSLKPFKEQNAKKFDLVATYEFNTPVPVSMVLHYDQQPKEFYKTPPNFPPFNDRKGIACIIANPHSRGKISRLGLVDDLMKHYPIDQWGPQRHNADLPLDDKRRNRDYNSSFYPYTMQYGKILETNDPIFKRGCKRLCRAEKTELYSSYRYVIAMENTELSPDYHTEKLWDSLNSGAIPIYLGPDTVDQYLPGPHCIINVKDFNYDMEKVANHLKEIDNNEELWKSYHSWRNGPVSPGFVKMWRASMDTANCRICLWVAQQKQKGILAKNGTKEFEIKT